MGPSYCGDDESSPRCSAPSDPGQVGSGGRFVAFGQSSGDLRSAWVDPSGDLLYLLVGDLSINNQSPSESAVWRVDLTNGAHEVISGTLITNPTVPLPKQVNETVGAGPSLGKAHGLSMGPDGNLYVHGQSGLFRVVPTTGERSLVTDYAFIDGTGACRFGPATSGPGAKLAMGGSAAEPVAHLAYGGTTGSGILQVTTAGVPACSIISSIGKDRAPVGVGPHGTAPTARTA